ncbi:MAG: DUF4382 domain-containing protein [Polyangiaceae bacterium]
MLLRPFLVFACLIPLVACGASDAESVGSLSLQLTDSPGTYERVDVDLASASIHDASQPADKGWVRIPLKSGTVNLLRLGKELPLAASSVPVGDYDRIEVTIRSATVTSAGSTLPLAIQEGKDAATIEYPFRVAPFDETEMLLEFDANASVTRGDSGALGLDPHITVRSERRK